MDRSSEGEEQRVYLKSNLESLDSYEAYENDRESRNGNGNDETSNYNGSDERSNDNYLTNDENENYESNSTGAASESSNTEVEACRSDDERARGIRSSISEGEKGDCSSLDETSNSPIPSSETETAPDLTSNDDRSAAKTECDSTSQDLPSRESPVCEPSSSGHISSGSCPRVVERPSIPCSLPLVVGNCLNNNPNNAGDDRFPILSDILSKPPIRNNKPEIDNRNLLGNLLIAERVADTIEISSDTLDDDSNSFANNKQTSTDSSTDREVPKNSPKSSRDHENYTEQPSTSGSRRVKSSSEEDVEHRRDRSTEQTSRHSHSPKGDHSSDSDDVNVTPSKRTWKRESKSRNSSISGSPAKKKEKSKSRREELPESRSRHSHSPKDQSSTDSDEVNTSPSKRRDKRTLKRESKSRDGASESPVKEKAHRSPRSRLSFSPKGKQKANGSPSKRLNNSKTCRGELLEERLRRSFSPPKEEPGASSSDNVDEAPIKRHRVEEAFNMSRILSVPLPIEPIDEETRSCWQMDEPDEGRVAALPNVEDNGNGWGIDASNEGAVVPLPIVHESDSGAWVMEDSEDSEENSRRVPNGAA